MRLQHESREYGVGSLVGVAVGTRVGTADEGANVGLDDDGARVGSEVGVCVGL